MKTTTLTDDEMAALETRDDVVRKKINDELRHIREMKEILRQDLETLERQGRDILRAVDSEQWWKLKGVLSGSEIESLCNISPSNLLED